MSFEKEEGEVDRASVRSIVFPARAPRVDRKFYEEHSRWREEKP